MSGKTAHRSPQPYLPLFVGEVLAGTVLWDGEERALLLLLMALAWASESPLPADAAKLARICGYDAERFASLWRTVSAQFEQTERGLIHTRVEQLRERAHQLQAQRVEASHKAVKARTKPSDGPSGAPSDGPSDGGFGAPFRAGQVRVGKGIAEPAPTVPQGGRRPRMTIVKPNEFEQQLIAAYHRILDDHPKICDWTRSRRRLLRSRIAERNARGEQADRIEFWRTFFEHVSDSDFLCGRASDDDPDPFVADLPWLLRPENFLKVIERYGIGRGNGQDGGAAYA